MSVVRKAFWTDTARGVGGSARPRKNGMNGTIPAVVKSRPDSGGGISDEEGTRRWSRSSKNRRNRERISLDCTGEVYRRPLAGPGGRLVPDLSLDLRFLVR